MHAPYSESGLKAVGTRLLAFLEIARVLLPLVLVFLASVLMVTARNQTGPPNSLSCNFAGRNCCHSGSIVAIELGSLLLGSEPGIPRANAVSRSPFYFASVRVFV